MATTTAAAPKKKSRKPPDMQISIPLNAYSARPATLENRFRALVHRALMRKRELIAEDAGLRAYLKHLDGTGAPLGDPEYLETRMRIKGVEEQGKRLKEALERLLGLGKVEVMVGRLQTRGWEGMEETRLARRFVVEG